MSAIETDGEYPFPRCPTCPVADGACYARRTGIGRFCLPLYHARMAELGGDGDPGRIRPRPPSIPAAADPALTPYERVLACPHLRPALGCGCSDLDRCDLGKGPDPASPGLVTAGFCLECVA